MDTVATSPVVTPDDLLRMPDEGRGYELVNGRLRELNVSNESSHVGGELLFRLKAFVSPQGLSYVFMADNSYRCFADDPDRVRQADVSFIAVGRLTPEQYHSKGHCTVCPDLVVEVVSPNDLMSDVTAKRREWLAAGARLVWVIDPDDRSVSANQPGKPVRVFQEADTLIGEPVLAGFSCPVADLFRLPGAAAS